MKRWAKWMLRIAAGLTLLLALAVGVGIAVLHSDWGRNRLRVFLEETISKASGGRAEIAELDFSLSSLSAELRGFVFHGTESPEEEPLFQARRIAVDATVLSWFGRKFRVDSVDVERPVVRIYLYEDGSNNLPKPETPSDGPPITHTLIDLGVGRFTIEEGSIALAEQTIPLHVRGEDLDLTLAFEAALERYAGNIAARQLFFETATLQPVPFDFRADLVLERDQLRLTSGALSYQESRIQFELDLEDFASPRIRVPFEGAVTVADFHREYSLPIERTGSLNTKGEFAYANKEWSLTGNARGSGLGWRSGAIRIVGITLDSNLQLEPDAFVFSNLRVNALGGRMLGELSLHEGKDLRFAADLSGFALSRLARTSGMGELGYDSVVSGKLSGRAEIAPQGVRNTVLEGDIDLRESEGENPLSGQVHARFFQRSGALVLRDTRLRMTESAVYADGNIRDQLSVNLVTRRFDDFLPVLAMVSEEPEKLIPVELLPGGEVRFRGGVSGDWEHPKIEGLLEARNLGYEGRSIDSVSLRAALSEDGTTVEELVARKGDLEVRGNAQVPLDQWSPSKERSLHAHIAAEARSLDLLLTEAGQKDLPVRGVPSATLEVDGTIDRPVARLFARVEEVELWGERFEEVVLAARYADDTFSLREAHLMQGKAKLEARARYQHQPGDLRDGSGDLTLSLTGVDLQQIEAFRAQNLDANAEMAGEYRAAFRVQGESVQLTEIEGSLEMQRILYAGKPAGQLALRVKTEQGAAIASLNGNLVDSVIEGETTVQLRDDYQSKGRLFLNRLTLDSVRSWLPASMNEQNLPVSMLLVSNATFEGPLADPAKMRGELVIDELRLARLMPQTRTLQQQQPFELTNAQPMRFTWDGKTLQAVDVALAGTGTSLSLVGSVTPGAASQQMNLRARGDLNFRIFNAFEPSLEAGGSSELDLTIRGTFNNPDVYGSLDLKDASIYLAGVPNGLDKVNGRVFLYRDRANIEAITAQSGGGDLTLSGFLSYSGGTPTFQLSFQGKDVRVRYPPGVSTSADAQLELTGSMEQSLLSGTVSITRAAVNPRSDLASILSSTAKPVATPSASQNEFLRNMRFDVQVRTAPDVRFDSSLTQDLSGEADLRLRGNPYNPVLLGNVAINQGEINFFGNKYYIDRGDISFLNPLKLEPVVNLDLRTRVRSIDVTLTFSGPIDKLNVNYRSDPPLQLNEIIALLTVGRAPETSPSLAQAQNEAAQSWQQVGASALVGQAVAAPIAGRLQKFFGVSRIKIDPRLTGVENNPQARLTVEQQVSRDITVTFITNLAGTQQQIVRLEWNFNPQFSMVALRDEDGLFGIDFLYRKRF